MPENHLRENSAPDVFEVFTDYNELTSSWRQMAATVEANIKLLHLFLNSKIVSV